MLAPTARSVPKTGLPLTKPVVSVPTNVTKNIIQPVNPASPRLNVFYRFWRSLTPEGTVPPYRAFDVVKVPRELLPHLVLLDVLDGGRDFRYRVVGTDVVQAVGRDFTGDALSKFISRHEPDGMADGYRRVATQLVPDLYHGTLESVGKEFISYERLALPFTDANGTVSYILSCFQFDSTTG
nr:PAS domain-containing protein [Rhodovibrio salinarum]